ncbi:hypothetical protein B0H14DRAFT_2913574, partial [Mycena olivaceomarginata]
MGARQARPTRRALLLPTYLLFPQFKLRQATQTEDIDLPARQPYPALICFFVQQKSKEATRSSDRATHNSAWRARQAASVCLCLSAKAGP